MKRLGFSRLVPQAKECVRMFPVEAAAGLLFFILYCINDANFKGKDMHDLNCFQAFFPMVITAVYCCNYFFKNKSRIFYYISLPVFLVPMIIFYGDLGGFVYSPMYACSLILAALLLIAHRHVVGNREFSTDTVATVLNALFSGLTGLLLFFAAALIFRSIKYLFGIQTENIISHTGFVVLYIVIPLVFFYMQHCSKRNGKPAEQPSKFLQIMLNGIFNPAIVIYTIILMLYLITIVVAWELPKGNVAYMVLAFITASFVGMMSQFVASKPLFLRFYRHFTWIAIPPLCLFWIGTIYRIQSYGFTESRVYLMAAGILMTAFVVFLKIRRLNNYRLMLLICSAAIVLLTYIPGISAKSMGLRSQENRVRCIASELGLVDSSGKLKNTESFVPVDNRQTIAVRELDAAYRYVAENAGFDKAESILGTNMLQIDKTTETDENFWMSMEFPHTLSVDVSDYGKVYPNADLDRDGSIKIGEKTIVRIPPDYFARYRNTYMEWKYDKIESDSICNSEPFIYRNDSCMVILDRIHYKDGESEFLYFGKATVFVR